MAILKMRGDRCEVRIKNYPGRTYFDEHIKVEAREQPCAKECEHYIVDEEGEKFTVEIKLHKDFDFNEFDRVRVQFRLSGHGKHIAKVVFFKPADSRVLQSSMTKELKYANVDEGNFKMVGFRFAFRGVAVGKWLYYPSA